MIAQALPSSVTPDEIVKGAAAALAMVMALYLGFKGRAKSEPHDEDIPGLAQRVGALIACVAIGLVVYFLGVPQLAWALAIVMVAALVVALVAYLKYQFLTTTHIYTIERVIEGISARVNILGGDTLEPAAQKKKDEGKTVQELVNGSAGDVGKVWDNSSRARSRQKYQLAYIGMLAGATTTLACVGIFFSWLFRK